MKAPKQVGYLRTAAQVFRESGPRGLLQRTRKFLSDRKTASRGIVLPVALEDVMGADWSTPAVAAPALIDRPDGPLTVNWVIPPAGPSSGGHNTIFRFISHLESQGHYCRVYIYDPHSTLSFAEAVAVLRNGYQRVRASIQPYSSRLDRCDALFATSWPTAYAVFNQPHAQRKYYLVQDLESLFYPVGSESLLAENTYRFGFHGFAGGYWLASKLREDYGMACDYFEHGANASQYTNQDGHSRSGIVFYARPVTPRRAFELGVITLELFHRKHPQTPIHLVGWDVGNYTLPFPFTNHGVLPPSELNVIYNDCAAGLVLSPTNMSHLPLELLAAGCIPVVNDGANNRLVSDNAFIEYVAPAPHTMADALSRVLRSPNLQAHAKRASESVQTISWDQASSKLEAILMRDLRD